jgi:chromate reductase
MVRILCLSGSLRQTSYNTAVLRAIRVLAAGTIEAQIFDDLGKLPLFNPDLEESLPAVVGTLKKELAQADGLLIASPEYAHGISGVLKNALDWLVSGEEFPNMPVALINTSPRASHAQEALREVIRTMSGNVIERACISVPLLGSNLDAEGIVRHEGIADAVLRAIERFRDAIVEQQKSLD